MDFTPLLTSIAKNFPPSKIEIKKSVPFTVMLLSPHPDDESITGSLALRLLRENNAHVVNVAVTLGSNKERQASREKELSEACQLLEFENVILSERWPQKQKELKSLIQKYQPDLIIAPHLKDHHPTHIKTGELLKNALSSLKKISVLVAWSEFWAAQAKPNLLLEIPIEMLNLQMQALLKHQGEIERNPYHLRLPGWMMDNVRRGSELIAGQGSASASMPFAVLYKLQLFKNGRFITPKFKSFLTTQDDLGQIFKLILEAASGSKMIVK